MSDNWDAVVSEMSQWNLGIVEQNPKRLAQVLSSYIIKGSALHQLNASEIIVYENIDDDFPGKEKVENSGEGNGKLATTVDGLMAAGAKFFDAVFFISMKKELRPKALKHNFDENSKTEKKIPVYNDKSKLIRYLFSYYFFIMIRAHPPTDIGDYRDQPMPKFITTVMAMKETMAEMAEYLAEFDLSKVDPGWVRLLDAKGLGQETASRLGLGVAGYRLPSVFNLIIPDMYIETPKEEKEQGDKDSKTFTKIKPQWFDDAILVAQSFRSAGFCWDFHPATRSPNVLAKYGNINKNITNLILEAYKPETIQMMIQTKKLAKMPVMDPSYTNYKTWNKNMVYIATSKIFK